MFEKMAFDYFKEEDVPEYLVEYLDTCRKRINGKLDHEVICSLKTNHSFHDSYLTSVLVSSANNGMGSCQINLIRFDIHYIFEFYGISTFHIEGDIVSPNANYPKPKADSSIAQVLDIWFDYQKEFECCILLDSERFIILRAQDVKLTS